MLRNYTYDTTELKGKEGNCPLLLSKYASFNLVGWSSSSDESDDFVLQTGDYIILSFGWKVIVIFWCRLSVGCFIAKLMVTLCSVNYFTEYLLSGPPDF